MSLNHWTGSSSKLHVAWAQAGKPLQIDELHSSSSGACRAYHQDCRIQNTLGKEAGSVKLDEARMLKSHSVVVVQHLSEHQIDL